MISLEWLSFNGALLCYHPTRQVVEMTLRITVPQETLHDADRTQVAVREAVNAFFSRGLPHS